MKDFSLSGFIAHIAEAAIATEVAEHESLERAAVVVEVEAKSLFGEYQDGAGPFVAWAELADATKADRVRLGFTENDPLERTGDVRDTIEHTVSDHEAHIGSDEPILEYLELGTEKMPPRSTLGIALVRKTDDVLQIVGDGFVGALVGEEVVDGRLLISGRDAVR